MKILASLLLVSLLVAPLSTDAALTLTSNSADRIDVGHGTVISNLTTFTVWMWIKPASLVNNNSLWGIGSNGGTRIASIRINGIAGDITTQIGQSPTSTTFTTNDAFLTAGNWYFIAVTYDQSATPRQHIYHGSLTSTVVEATYGTSNSGGGNRTSESTGSLTWGNEVVSSSYTRGFSGAIAVAGYENKVLSIGELRSLQFKPRKLPSTVDFHIFGFNGTGTQTDYSGKGNAGTITGAPTVTSHVPVKMF